MTFFEVMINFLLSVLASLIGILIVLWVERQKRSKLRFTIVDNQVISSDLLGRPDATWLQVCVQNAPISRWLKWAYSRETAYDCRAWISFYRLDGTRLQQAEMEGRWKGSPEPQFITIQLSDGLQASYPIINPFTMNIAENQEETLGIVIRLRNEDFCYGFWNGSYKFQMPTDKWCDPDWRLDQGIFLLKIRVTSGGREHCEAFRLINDVPYKDFRLEPLLDSKMQKNLGVK